MTADNFDRALSAVLVHEGGYANHPQDPGGATMRGVTQATYNAWLRTRGEKPKSVKHISDLEIRSIYREQYWSIVRADELPAGLDYAVFDYAVNSGPRKAVTDLQRCLGISADGIVGVKTLSAVRLRPVRGLVDQLCDRRLSFLKSLKTWKTFGKGWERRVAGVRSLAKQMVSPVPAPPDIEPAPIPRANPAPKADPADIDLRKTPEAAGGAMTGIGTVGTVATEAAESLAPVADYSWIIKTVFVCLLLLGVGITLYAVIRRIKANET